MAGRGDGNLGEPAQLPARDKHRVRGSRRAAQSGGKRVESGCSEEEALAGAAEAEVVQGARRARLGDALSRDVVPEKRVVDGVAAGGGGAGSQVGAQLRVDPPQTRVPPRPRGKRSLDAPHLERIEAVGVGDGVGRIPRGDSREGRSGGRAARLARKKGHPVGVKCGLGGGHTAEQGLADGLCRRRRDAAAPGPGVRSLSDIANPTAYSASPPCSERSRESKAASADPFALAGSAEKRTRRAPPRLVRPSQADGTGGAAGGGHPTRRSAERAFSNMDAVESEEGEGASASESDENPEDDAESKDEAEAPSAGAGGAAGSLKATAAETTGRTWLPCRVTQRLPCWSRTASLATATSVTWAGPSQAPGEKWTPSVQ